MDTTLYSFESSKKSTRFFLISVLLTKLSSEKLIKDSLLTNPQKLTFSWFQSVDIYHQLSLRKKSRLETEEKTFSDRQLSWKKIQAKLFLQINQTKVRQVDGGLTACNQIFRTNTAEEILNGKLHFLCSAIVGLSKNTIIIQIQPLPRWHLPA